MRHFIKKKNQYCFSHPSIQMLSKQIRWKYTFNPSRVQAHDTNRMQRKRRSCICKLLKDALTQHHDLQNLVKQTSMWIKSRIHSIYRQQWLLHLHLGDWIIENNIHYLQIIYCAHNVIKKGRWVSICDIHFLTHLNL